LNGSTVLSWNETLERLKAVAIAAVVVAVVIIGGRGGGGGGGKSERGLG
jgi:hypothetical protein